MSEKIIRVLLDDLEGGEVEADAGTIVFGVDGKNYEIDLSKKNAARLRSVMKEFIEHARPAGRTPTKTHATKSPTSSGYSSDQLKAIREWARKEKPEWAGLSDRGRVAAEILEAFEKSHAPGGAQLFSAV